MRIVKLLCIMAFIQMCAASVMACQCQVYLEPTADQAREMLIGNVHKADAVFVGEIVAMDATTIKFKVSSVWKGSGVDEEAKLLQGRRSATGEGLEISTCDYRGFKQGGKYLVFAHEIGGELVTDKCSGTKPVSEVKGEIEDLNKLYGGEQKSNKMLKPTRFHEVFYRRRFVRAA